jgi:phage terminase large subunit-like protein
VTYPRPFDLGVYLDGLDLRLLDETEGRRQITKLDPLAFALIYLPHHLRDESTGEQITFSPFHLDLFEQALEWVKPLRVRAAFRDAYVAPRGSGKSTLLFLILPLWAAAHGHIKFIAAFADAAPQAEQHLSNLRHELETNELLGRDFPGLCRPQRGTQIARVLANSRGQIQQENGFTFMARGIDSAVAGMKVGRTRPQVMILDDVEPEESSYSAHQAKKRLTTVLDNVLPLNIFARVLIVGTVTMPGSIVHQLVRSATSTEQPAEWITDENFRVHYYPAILTADDGSERSLWPEKWPLADLQEIRHTRSFAKNFMNAPLPGDGAFWQPEDITIEDPGVYGNTLLWIDPAVTSRTTSDYTGMAVVSRPIGNGEPVYVRHAEQVRLTPAALREKVVGILAAYPEIGLMVVETNQGGDTWAEIFHDLPVKYRTEHSTDPKPIRIQRALVAYQRNRAKHTRYLPAAVDQMLAYPNVNHDDVVDAVTSAVNYFTARTPTGATAVSKSYL